MKIKVINMNSPGIIDAYCKGEVCTTLMNLSNEKGVIKDGERICKMIIAKHKNAGWKSVDSLLESGWESVGFGHTGKA